MSDAPVTPDDTVLESALDTLGLELPPESEAAIELLAAHVLEARAAAESHLDDLKRLAADFENYRKRADRDRAGMIASASHRVVAALLPVLDSLDAAATTTAETPGEERLRSGLLGTREQLLDALASEGLRTIEVEPGQPFDPTLHEAVSGGGEGHLVVVAELRRGYTMGGRLLRPSMVDVAAEDPMEDAPGDGPEE